MNQTKMLNVIHELPSSDIDKELKWDNEKLGFTYEFRTIGMQV